MKFKAIAFSLSAFLILLGSYNHQAIANGDITDYVNNADILAGRIKKLEEKAVESDNKKIKLSGHVNRGALWLDNKVDSNLAHVDNANASSRLNLTGAADLNEDVSIGATFNVEFTSNANDVIDIHEAHTNLEASDRIRLRISELFFKSKSLGQVSMGRGRMASDGTMEEQDLSGTIAASLGASGPAFMAGGARFTYKSTGVKFTSARLAGIFDSADGLSRRDRVLYSTPSFYGLSWHTSHGYQNTGDSIDMALKYAGKFLGTKVAAAIALSKDQTTDGFEFEMINGSVGALFPLSISGKEDTGINVFFASANKDWNAEGYDNGRLYMGKLGLIERFFSLGNSALAVDLSTYTNMTLDPSALVKYKGESWGITFVQHLDAVATELYAGYRNYSFKRKNTSDTFNDIDAVIVGARVKL